VYTTLITYVGTVVKFEKQKKQKKTTTTTSWNLKSMTTNISSPRDSKTKQASPWDPNQDEKNVGFMRTCEIRKHEIPGDGV